MLCALVRPSIPFVVAGVPHSSHVQDLRQVARTCRQEFSRDQNIYHLNKQLHMLYWYACATTDFLHKQACSHGINTLPCSPAKMLQESQKNTLPPTEPNGYATPMERRKTAMPCTPPPRPRPAPAPGRSPGPGPIPSRSNPRPRIPTAPEIQYV